MSNKNLLRSLFLTSTIWLVSAAGCRLAPPPSSPNPNQFVCSETDAGTEDDAGTDDAAVDAADDGGGEGGSNVNTVVPAVACNGDNAIPFPYVQPYVQSDAVASQVASALGSMSIPEKARQMRGTAFSGAAGPQYTDIQRSYDTLSIRGFHYRDASRGMNLGEDMSGVKPNAAFFNNEHAGYATSFPVSMARGAAFDLDLEYAVGEAIGDEMQAARETLLLAPCMNILRHPYWGRAQETYGEDSFHVGRLATAMTIGVQKHIAANAKHFMAYDIEVGRESNNAELDEQTLREIYGRHFRMVVQDGGVSSVMASYNKVRGTKSTQNSHTLTDVLRTDFGFKGFVLSDWWAMPPSSHASTDSSQLKAYAIEAVHAGLDVELPWGLCFSQLESVVDKPGGVSGTEINTSVGRILEQKFRFNANPISGEVGLLSHHTGYANSQISCNGTHLKLSEKAALESMVLLKNDNTAGAPTLPINASAMKTVAIVGATVPYVTTNGGTSKSDGTGGIVNFAQDFRGGDLGSSRVISDPNLTIGPFAGLCRAVGGMPMEAYDKKTNSRSAGTCENAPLVNVTTATTSGGDISAAMAAASAADFVVVMAGLTAQDEGEEYTQAGDRDSNCQVQNCFALDAKQTDSQYQGIQNKLIQAVAALGKPMVVVLEGASVIDTPWISDVPAVVMAWYPGMVGGSALGKLLFGQANFSGKLPFTWSSHVSDFDTWKGTGTTTFGYYVGYKWFDLKGTTPQFPFGYGLSYTKFDYKNLQLGCSDMSQGAVMPVVVNVANSGTVAGDEIVEVFVSFNGPTPRPRRPAKELKGFARVHLEAGEEKQVTIPVRLADLDYFQTDAGANATTGHWVVENGTVNIQVGGSSDKLPLTKTVMVNGY